MQKRITALLLALCLSLTCALGAWAEGPTETPALTAEPEPDAVAASEPTPAPTAGEDLKEKLDQYKVTVSLYSGDRIKDGANVPMNDFVDPHNIAVGDTLTIYYLITEYDPRSQSLPR